jgi:hypothetical protein
MRYMLQSNNGDSAICDDNDLEGAPDEIDIHLP